MKTASQINDPQTGSIELGPPRHGEIHEVDFWKWQYEAGMSVIDLLTAELVEARRIIVECNKVASPTSTLRQDEELSFMGLAPANIDCAIQELEKKCAEMKALIQTISRITDSDMQNACIYCGYIQGIRDRELEIFSHSDMCKVSHALSDDCGKGYVKAEELEKTKEVLEECRDRLNEVRTGEDFECRCYESAEKADEELTRLESLTKQ